MQKIGVAGVGAIGGAVCRALTDNKIRQCTLHAISDLQDKPAFDVPNLDFEQLCTQCDIIVEALVPDAAPDLARTALTHGKTIIMISSAALLRFPDLLDLAEQSAGRILVPSGALSGIDGVNALHSMGITSATIRSTKKPMAYDGAPHIIDNDIDLTAITQPQCLFEGNALDAAKAFPANVNVAATLSLAALGPENTFVEVWADPAAPGNSHEIDVQGAYSSTKGRVDNRPDPDNPKTSMLAAHSIIATLKSMTEKVVIL